MNRQLTRDEAKLLLNAVIKQDFSTILRFFPNGVEHRADHYVMESDFELAGEYETDARYIRPARDKMFEIVLTEIYKVI